jgi:Flp pilus assembly protein TadD
MLRGNLSAARRRFERAYSLDPTNPVILNNLELLNGSRRFIERPPKQSTIIRNNVEIRVCRGRTVPTSRSRAA